MDVPLLFAALVLASMWDNTVVPIADSMPGRFEEADRHRGAKAGPPPFTTFSTMALDFTTVPRREALAYLATTLVLGLLAAWLGLQVGDH